MNRSKAFTLVELMVVIAIIALLIAVLLPALAQVRRRAKAIVCQTTLKQWALMFTMYADDNDGSFMEGEPADQGPNVRNHWMDALKPYYWKQREVTLCPIAPQKKGSFWYSGRKFRAWGPFDGTEWTGDLIGLGSSYGMNNWLTNPPLGCLTNEHGRLSTKHNWRKSSVKGAALIPMFLDCIWTGAWPEHNDPPPEYDDAPAATVWYEIGSFCIDRHFKAINGVFLDSSVQKIGLKELWRLKWSRNFNIHAVPQDWTYGNGWMVNFKDY